MLTTIQVQALTDSVSQAIADFQTVMSGTTSGSPNMNTVINGVSGTGATNTVGRVLALNDLTSELSLLSPVSNVSSSVTAYLNGLRSNSAFYIQFFPFFDKLDQLVSGLNAYLTTNTMQVSGYFAASFNYWVSTLTQLSGTRTSFPVAISQANYYPISAVDGMYTFTTGTGAAMTSGAAGVATSSVGGGVGQCYIYKSNAGNAAGGATFTITFTTPAGGSSTATYATVSGTPSASGTLAAGFTITGCIGSAITNVTGVGMTSGEQYAIGMRLVRPLQGY